MKLNADNLRIVGTEMVRGLPWLRWSDGSLLPVLRGGDGPTGQPAPAPPVPPAPPAPAPSARTFTQEEVNRLLAAEKDQGRRSAEGTLLADLGVTDAAEAKRLLDAHRDAERARLSETERAQADATRAAAEAARDRAAAAQERKEAAIERQLVRSGLQLPTDPKEADAALAQAVRLVDLAGEATTDAVAAAVEVVKTRFAPLFAPAAGNGGGNGGRMPNGDPAGRGRPGAGGKTGIEAGRERARQEQELRQKAGNPLDRLNVVGRR